MLLDASALLAYILREPGATEIEHVLESGVWVSAVNLAEVTRVLARRQAHPVDPLTLIAQLNLLVLPFGPRELREFTMFSLLQGQLSLADRICLATAKAHGLPVLTGDRAWAELGLSIDIKLIR